MEKARKKVIKKLEKLVSKLNDEFDFEIRINDRCELVIPIYYGIDEDEDDVIIEWDTLDDTLYEIKNNI